MKNVSGLTSLVRNTGNFLGMHYFNDVDFLLISECHV